MLPSTVGFFTVPLTVAWMRYVPEACSTSASRPGSTRPSMLAPSRRSSLPSRPRPPERCAVVNGARSARRSVRIPSGPKETWAGPSFSKGRSLRTIRSCESVMVPALSRKRSSDPRTSNAAVSEPLSMSKSGASRSTYWGRSGTRSVPSQV